MRTRVLSLRSQQINPKSARNNKKIVRITFPRYLLDERETKNTNTMLGNLGDMMGKLNEMKQ
jgi:hypothetical protein